jgi:hypothetical protein
MPRELVRVLDDDVLICLLRVRPSYFIVSECGTESCPGPECWVPSDTTEEKEDITAFHVGWHFSYICFLRQIDSAKKPSR